MRLAVRSGFPVPLDPEQINIHTAKAQLSKLIAEGKEVVIARYGHPVARLVPIKPFRTDRVPGTAEGKIKMTDDVFAPLPDTLQHEFYEGASNGPWKRIQA